MKGVVVGIGNPYLSDDAVGLRVARAVRAATGSEVTVHELQTGGLDVVERISGHACAVVVDALGPDEGAPGALVALPVDGPIRSTVLSHDGGLAVAVATARALGLPLPAHLTLLGIVGADLETFGTDLSEAVEGAVPRAVAAVLALLGGRDP
ncbi:MAG: hydrogenase maturation protease [Myxococcales bacterium]|nr:hydrogenase maturation protease [Myxococcales bacterium]